MVYLGKKQGFYLEIIKHGLLHVCAGVFVGNAQWLMLKALIFQ